jgi:hypothetical protein
MIGFFFLNIYINRTLKGWNMIKVKRITLEGNKNNNSIFFPNYQAHLINNYSFMQNAMKVGVMLLARNEKTSIKDEAVVLKTQK